MTINQAKTVLYTEASRLRTSASQIPANASDISKAIDAVCGNNAYIKGELNKSLSLYYADINGYARDLNYTPSNTEVADELLKLAMI